jgi:DNA-binding transcriptional LysR family regulator
METDRLKYFCTIAETGSITRAAELLNVSHSGLSKAMSVLKVELNQQLFRPLGRGLELTDTGREVYNKSKKLLEFFEQLKNSKNSTQSLRHKIGLAEIFSLSLSGDIAEALQSQVDLYEIDSGEGEVKILQQEIDFAVSFIPFPHNELEYLKIKKVQMGVYYSSPKFKNLDLKEIPFVVPNTEIKNNPLSIKSRDGWPIEVERNCAFSASSLSLALQLVQKGVAAVFIPKFLASSNMQEFELKKSILSQTDRDIFIVKKKNIEETKAMKIVAKIIRQRC